MRNKPLFLLTLALLAGCNKSPYDRTVNAAGGGGTNTFGGTNYVVFSSELLSGGGAFEYPGSAGQSLVFNDTSNPISERSIRYSWTGERVNGGFLFAGFTLMHTPLQADYSSTAGRDLRAAGYTRVTFYARGTLGSQTLAKIEVVDDGNSSTANASCLSLSTDGTLDDNVNAGATPCGTLGTLSSSWTRFSIPIASPSTALASVKDFLKVTYIFNNVVPGNTNPGQGGTIYVDQIQLEP